MKNNKYSNNVLNILTAKSFKGIGKAWIIKHIKNNLSDNGIVSLINDYTNNNISLNDFIDKKNSITLEINTIIDKIDGIISFCDENFPNYNANIPLGSRPIVLFYKGNLKLLDKYNKKVTVIGLLDADEEIERAENMAVSYLVENNVTIISGLALGCDSIAHQKTLEKNGKTVAILPCDIANIIPASNKKLANDIVNRDGLLISEYYNKPNSKKELFSRYQERDRLQALFSDCVLLSASYAKNSDGLDSGARIAMEYAYNYGIQRAVIEYSNKYNPKYELNNQIMNNDKYVLKINYKNINSFINNINFNNKQAEYKQLDINSFI